jgi:PhnB protein
MSVNHIPDGCNSVSVYLIVKDGQAAIDFYGKAFGAKGGMCMPGPDGTGIMHAELQIGNSTVMLTEENLDWGAKSVETMGGSPASLHVYVENVDAAFQTAVDAGCTVVAPLMDTFWGDRYGKLQDPFGFQWGLATHVEDVPEEEMATRAQAFFAQAGEEC